MGAFIQALDALARVEPGQERLLLTGACFARLRRGAEAVTVFTELLGHDPDCFEALTWMTILKRGEPEEAIGYALRAVELRPDEASGYGALGTLHLAAHRTEEAILALLKAIEIAPDVPEHHHNLAASYLAARRNGEAVLEFQKAIALDPQSPQNYLALASAYTQFGMAGPAIGCLTEGLERLPDYAPLHTAIAGAFALIRNDAAAEHHHRRALQLSPQSRGGYATWLLNQGRFDEANKIFSAMRREGEDSVYASYGLMLSRKLSGSEEDAAFIGEMESLLTQGGMRPRSEMYLRYALGRAGEGQKRYGEAMAHFNAANHIAESIYHRGQSVTPDRFASEQDQVRHLYEAMSDRGIEGSSTETPIFIVGMIRSGTTLLDQIVSSHPEVRSGGELRFWMEEVRRLVLRGGVPTGGQLNDLAEEYTAYARLLTGPATYVTDKMPLNFEHIGVLHQAMPNARFLHIRRHPVDTCLSIWTTFFGQGPLFAYGKEKIVAYYREYLRAMEYWRNTIPRDRLFELDYEQLISEPEPTIRKAIEFCGLPWEDACLHHDQNDRAINTPSRWQARQPIYRTSVERWRRYEPWLGQFAELLQDA
jgi:tetratricopeptide (TPR) repeat protein